MVEGINPSLSNSAISNIRQRPVDTGSGSSSGSSESSARSSGTSDVVEVSARGKDYNEIVKENQNASGRNAPTTQELILAKNADRVAAALGNTVDVTV